MPDKIANEGTKNTIDMHYQLMDTEKATSIIQKAMDLAREEIPKGAVATYIPDSGAGSVRTQESIQKGRSGTFRRSF